MVLFLGRRAGSVGSLRILFSWLAVVMGGGVLIWLVWLLLGRAIALSLDRHFLVAATDHPISPFLMSADEFIIGSRRWPLSRSGRFSLKVNVDGKNQFSVSSGDDAITLGAVSKIWAEPSGRQYQFSPEAADVISFNRSMSRLAWPTTPFRYSFMGVKSPSWRRHAYDRLVWRKISGATLEIVWRDEQSFYAGIGWTDTNTDQLARIAVRRSPFEGTIVDYLVSTKGWSRGDYRLEWSVGEHGLLIVTVIALSDASASQPGVGKSVLLHLDSASRKVIKELAFQ